MTVTLQDVAMIPGLLIHGPPITGTCDIDCEQFSYPPAGVDDVNLQRYARAFILALLGGALFADKTGTHLWSWERLHVGRPDFGRPPVPIVVSHVHDDVVNGLHDHLLSDEALLVDPLATGEDHRIHSTHEPSTSSGLSMRPPSLIMPVRPSASLESPLSPPDVSIPAHSSRPETTIPSTFTPIQPSISLDAPPPITESIAPPPITKSIAPPPVTESIASPPITESLHLYLFFRG
ncbi:hypothetical protein CK203_035856 [Vitis vinifera]|uniref:Uncharacterized protein n=1 Tax=Vitis vinifera TaxID=29760 RepID=A0A438HZZ8_VITVI|nr:hypothetical protein CK203_035856 [Vitis vinifera]